jgi:cytochrome b561
MPSNSRYTAVAIILHWLIATGVFLLIAIGLTMAHGTITAATKFQLFQLHKSVGITVLGLIVARIVWRLGHRPPALPDTMPPIERKAAASTHFVFYLLLFGLPLSGWALVSVSPINIPTILFGLVRWPHIGFLASLHNKAAIAAVLDNVHAYGAWALLTLIVLHVAAALRHHFLIGDDVLGRMLPAVGPTRAHDALHTSQEDRK